MSGRGDIPRRFQVPNATATAAAAAAAEEEEFEELKEPEDVRCILSSNTTKKNQMGKEKGGKNQ